MRSIFFFLLSSLFSFLSYSQHLFSITGKVIDEESGKPLAYASVFLNNTTFGAITEEDGSFSFEANPGSYDLIANFFSYSPIIFKITIDSSFNKSYVLKMTPIQYDLKEISVESSRGKEWYDNYEIFKQNFIGTSKNSLNCEILNPEVLIIDFNHKKRTLEVKARDALIIENKALGYKIHYLLQNYTQDFSSGYTTFLGYPRFEKLIGKNGKKKKWDKERKRAYLGSNIHFFRSVCNGELDSEGFSVIEVIKKPNPNRPSDEEIKNARTKLRASVSNGLSLSSDSPARVTISQASNPRFINYTNNQLLKTSDFTHVKSAKTILAFENYLQVTFEKEYAEFAFKGKKDKTPQNTMLSLVNGPSEISQNGLLNDPLTVLYNGYMGWEKIADMLPTDYELLETSK